MQKGVSHKNMACVFFCLDSFEVWQLFFAQEKELRTN